ncbi:MAG TPA: YaaA family protein [Candidatus Izemoplasmatales bacterium]|nr:YaaA family protein [Candidatus Izemoplasmatales bacterium]
MKIIISPSKTQNQLTYNHLEGQRLADQDASLFLFNQLKMTSKKDIASLMKIKKQLLEDTYDLYQSFKKSDDRTQAIHLYSGVVFDKLDINDYTPQQKQYMYQHLTILSAMYGPLRPDSLVWPYRLDMTMKPGGINLYHYWQNHIDHHFYQTDLIINLASNEFSRMLKKTQARIIDIVFKEENSSGKLRTVSYSAKVARGKMLNQIILNQIFDIEQIKSLVVDNYQYHKGLSTEKQWIFIKEHKRK